MAKTKIVCTIGPSSESPDVIRKMIEKGMSVARLNFSHGSHEKHGEVIRTIRQISDELQKPVAILQDLCGPKIRVGKLPEEGIRLETGDIFTLTNEALEYGDQDKVSVSYKNLPLEVNEGDTILLADGMLELLVKSATRSEIVCKVVIGGILTSHKGINLPFGTLRTDAVTDKDIEDLLFGIDNEVDFIALSFVRSAADILKVKNIIAKEKKHTPVIAKIEKHEAISHIDEIMQVSDGIMVARGDLGVEIPLEKVPVIQKFLVKKANNLGKPVIIATQMLRSMVNSPRPTRAEATDVANAVLDGTDAIMLSEETASGEYPVEAVEYMTKVAEEAEVKFPHEKYLKLLPEKSIADSVCYASCILADHLEAAIVATTRSGFTAMQISRFRPKPKIIALSPEKRTVRRLALYWGCIPSIVAEHKDTDEMIAKTAEYALQTGELSKGELAVLTAGHPVWSSGTTNMLRVINL